MPALEELDGWEGWAVPDTDIGPPLWKPRHNQDFCLGIVLLRRDGTDGKPICWHLEALASTLGEDDQGQPVTIEKGRIFSIHSDLGLLPLDLWFGIEVRIRADLQHPDGSWDWTIQRQ